MKLYAETRARLTRQIIADTFAAVWTGLWIWIAVQAHQLISALAAPGRALVRAGNSIQRGLGDAGERIDHIPLVGDALRGGLVRAGGAGGTLAEAGQAQQQLIESLALWTALLLAILPPLTVLVLWLPARLHWIREASAADRMRRRVGADELFALRALATQPLRRIARATSGYTNPTAAWRDGDTEVITKLARLHSKTLGLRRA